MSVYDEARERAEYLASLLDTPLLNCADGDPMSGYQRVELARNWEFDSSVFVSLSSGEQALLRVCANLLAIAVDVVAVDEFLAHQVGVALLAVGAELATTGTEHDARMLDIAEARAAVAYDSEMGF